MSQLKDEMNRFHTFNVYSIQDFAEGESKQRSEIGPVLPDGMDELASLFELAKRFIKDFLQEVQTTLERSQ